MNDREMVAVLAVTLATIRDTLRGHMTANPAGAWAPPLLVLDIPVTGTSRNVGGLLQARLDAATLHLGKSDADDLVSQAIKGFPHPPTPGPFDRPATDYTHPTTHASLGKSSALTPTGEGVARQLCAAGYVLADAAYRLGVADAGCRVSWMDTVRYEAAADVFRERAGKATDPDLCAKLVAEWPNLLG